MELTKEELLALEQAEQILELTQCKGWQEVFRPMLEAKAKNSWVDPRKTKSSDEFFYEYVTAWGFALAASEILDFVSQMKAQKENLIKKQQSEEVNNFKIGA